MSRKKKAPKKGISLKAFADTDADIIAWWEAMPNGERSRALREIIRAAISPQPITAVKPLAHVPDVELVRVCDDAAWIRSALSDLPSYLEHMLSRVVLAQGSNAQVEMAGNRETEARVAQEVIDRRRVNMKQSAW